MKDITLEELLEAGCHFGHQVNRRNPRADEYIFEARSNVHIIDLEKTRDGLVKAASFLKELSAKGGTAIVVGTKRQAKDIVEEEVKRSTDAGAKGLFYITSRWIGGTLTNFSEVSKNFKKLAEIDDYVSGRKDGGYTKFELTQMQKEKEKLLDLYGGIKDMAATPDTLIIIGTQLEQTAVREAISNGVSTVGIVDTNADPTVIDYPIPANDDAVGSIKLITSYMVDAWIEGSKVRSKNEESRIKEEEKAKAAELAKAKKEEAEAIARRHAS